MNKPSDILKIRDSIIYNENAKKNIRIASIGDTHISDIVGKDDINHISEALYKVKPDYICMLGDLVDSPDELKKDKKVEELKTLIKNSSTIAPTMVILGAHDFIDESREGFPDVIDETTIWNEIDKIPNVHVLNDKTYSDNNIFIGGYRQKKDVYYNFYRERKEDPKSYYRDFKKKEELYKDLPNDVPKVLLTHSPAPINYPAVKKLLSGYNVIITGHYHNGCVPAMLDDIYPKHAGLITPRKRILPKHARGIIKLDTGTYLIYNGGWIKIQACSPKVLQPLDKLCNRQMDITTLTSDIEYKEEQIKNKRLVLK